jgi:hypothetical protein
MRTLWRDEGAAMVIALLALSMLTAIGVAMLLTSSSDVVIAGAFRDQRSGIFAADAIVTRALDEIAAADWTELLSGTRSAALADGLPLGARTLSDGSRIDLQQIVNMANCQKASACTIADLTAVTERRPWGMTNPRWQLYAYGPLRSMLPAGVVDSPWYVVLLVADDPLLADDVIALRGEAFGPRNAHAVTELLAARPAGISSGADSDYNGAGGPGSMMVLSWREVR